MKIDYTKLLAAKMGIDADYVRYIFGELWNSHLYNSETLQTLVDSLQVVNSDNNLEKTITFVLYDKVHTIHMFRSSPYKSWNATLAIEDSYMVFANDFFFEKTGGVSDCVTFADMPMFAMDGVSLVDKYAKDANLPPIHTWDAVTARRNFGLCGIVPDADVAARIPCVDSPIDDSRMPAWGGLLGVMDNCFNLYEGRIKIGKGRS